MKYAGQQKFIVFQQSFDKSGWYVAPTLFYVNALRAIGYSIEIQPPSSMVPAGFSAAVICGAKLRDAMTAQVALEPIVIDDECGIYRFADK